MTEPRGITHLPSGHYRWRVWRGGKWYTGTEPSLEDAVSEREQMIAQLDQTAARLPTMRDALDSWWAETANEASTQAVHRAALGRVPATFLDKPLHKIKAHTVATLWRTMTEQGTAKNTQVKAQSAMSAAWQQALEWDQTDRPNPFRIVRVEPDPSEKVVPPSVETVLKLVEVLPPPLDTLAWVMAVTGARPGEVCGMQVDALKGNNLLISRSLSRTTGELTEGKNGRRGWRTVEIDDHTAGRLRALIDGRTEGLIFNGLRPDDASARVKKAAAAAELDFRTLYTLRHFAASQALQGGRTVVEVAAMLGDNPSTVQDTYAHLVDESVSAALTNAVALSKISSETT